MATVWIPAPLQELAGGRQTVKVAGATVRDLVKNLNRRYPGFQSAIVVDGVMLKPGISVVVDGSVVTKGLLQPVRSDSEVFFVPAIGGG